MNGGKDRHKGMRALRTIVRTHPSPDVPAGVLPENHYQLRGVETYSI